MEHVTRPSRSDDHLSTDAAAQMEAATKSHFDDLAPRRHSKPQRSEYSSAYSDALSSPDGPIPENLQFQHLEKDETQKLVTNGSKVAEEFMETEYYRDLNCVDKQHHTTGTGFIRTDSSNGKGFSLEPDPTTETHASCRGNPATNDWIPAAVDTADSDTGKPNRSG